MVKFDDVGSLPLPKNIERKSFKNAILNRESRAFEILQESMEMKIEAGVEVPCYPQLRDMKDQFLEPMKNPSLTEDPYLIREENAYIPEVKMFEELDVKIRPHKVCITGPLELSISEFGNSVYKDVMMNIARSINRYIRNIERIENFDIDVISIDEPSLGTNPDISFQKESLIQAWDIAGKSNTDIQIHLHSPLYAKIACESKGVDIIDMGIGSSPDRLEEIDIETIREYGKKVRMGISRTDVHSMGSEFYEKHDENIWKGSTDWDDFLKEMDPPSRIAERINSAYEKFDGLIEYLGPECGLGGAKSRELARKILENTRLGYDLFKNQ